MTLISIANLLEISIVGPPRDRRLSSGIQVIHSPAG